MVSARCGSADALIGTHIGRYAITRKLAEGGMGAVYIAEHLFLANTRKVVKILLPEYSNNASIRMRFEREATAVARLRHKHIIKIDDFGRLPDGQLFLMMPFLDGEPLEEHLRRNGRLTQHHALHIMIQVCRALQHAHDHGIVHRDLKPANIFITQTEDNPYEVTLIDLGIARDLGTANLLQTQHGMSIGTPGYMAVEQYGNAGNASPAADLYAAAIVTWEMLTGRLPWGSYDARVLYRKQTTERPAPAPEISPGWLSILHSALAVRPSDRPASMRAFAVALASSTPAMWPHVPSGGDMLLRLAKEFVQQAPPTLETVRITSDALTPVAWPRPDTGPVPKLSAAVTAVHAPARPRRRKLAVAAGFLLALGLAFALAHAQL